MQDAASLAAYDAVDALRLRGADLASGGLGLWGASRRFAYVAATGGPYAGHVSLARLRRLVPAAWAPQMTLLSVLEPIGRAGDATAGTAARGADQLSELRRGAGAAATRWRTRLAAARTLARAGNS